MFVLFTFVVDDVFVATDKWKNARQQVPKTTPEKIAAAALPNDLLNNKTTLLYIQRKRIVGFVTVEIISTAYQLLPNTSYEQSVVGRNCIRRSNNPFVRNWN